MPNTERAVSDPESIALVKKALRAGRKSARGVIKDRQAALEKRRKKFPVEPALLAVSPLLADLGAHSQRVLVAEGDSWFDYPWNDVLSMLEDEHGYDIEEVAHRGDTIVDMAYSQSDKFTRKIERVIRNGHEPTAILLSGGGNDIAGDDFHMLLNHRASPAPNINEEVVRGLIDERIILAYARLIAAISETCRKLLHPRCARHRARLRTMPFPMGAAPGAWDGCCQAPWLEPGFRRKGYAKLTERKRIIKKLIDRFNDRLGELAATPELDFVHYVNLRRTLTTGATYKDWWSDELHPTKKGFKAVAKKIDLAIPKE